MSTEAGTRHDQSANPMHYLAGTFTIQATCIELHGQCIPKYDWDDALVSTASPWLHKIRCRKRAALAQITFDEASERCCSVRPRFLASVRQGKKFTDTSRLGRSCTLNQHFYLPHSAELIIHLATLAIIVLTSQLGRQDQIMTTLLSEHSHRHP